MPAVKAGTWTEPSTQPLGVFLRSEWLPSIRASVRPLSLHRYDKVVSVYIEPRPIAAIALKDLRPGAVNAFYSELEDAGLSVASRRLIHAVLRRALGSAVRWEKIPRNAAAQADPPAIPTSRAQSWSPRELRQFLATVEGDRLAALWRLAATSGMRRGELAGLCWQTVDLDRASLRVEQQLIPTKGGCTFGPPKSKRSERTIALDDETVEALRHHRDTQLLERDLAGLAYDDQDLVFCDEFGHAVDPRRLSEAFTRHRKAAGIPTGSLHTLRHSAATLALVGGVPLHVVAARLGDDPKTVLSVYAHLLPTSDTAAAQVVASALIDKPLTEPSPSPL